MHTGHLDIVLRALLSLLILAGLLWLTLSHAPHANVLDNTADWTENPVGRGDELYPLFWEAETHPPTACTALTA